MQKVKDTLGKWSCCNTDGEKSSAAHFQGKTQNLRPSCCQRHQNKKKKLSFLHYEDLTTFMHGKQKKKTIYMYRKILPHMWVKEKSLSPTTSKDSFAFKLCTTHFFDTQVFSISDLHKRLTEHNCCLTMHSYSLLKYQSCAILYLLVSVCFIDTCNLWH